MIVENSILSPQRDFDQGNDTSPDPGSATFFLRLLRRILIFMVGTGVLMVGVVMIVAPGPAFLVIPLGLAILATEFLWARRLLQLVKERLKRAQVSGGSEPAEPHAQCSSTAEHEQGEKEATGK